MVSLFFNHVCDGTALVLMIIHSMFIPIDDDASGVMQSVWRISKDKEGNVHKKNICGVRYVKLTDPPI